MRERINRLARGIVDAELPKLFLSPVKVEETLGSDTIYKRELYLSSENNLSIKGLAYSTHSRVRIASRSFGGLRNHIVYEVDTSWCENGDVIRGTINLVTNGGELEVPFLFCVETTASIRVLSTLHTVEDFVDLAQKDMDLALRLMEYKDFTDAPFLQDLRVRAVFDGIRGHGNRQNALEEFFLGLGVKEPVELTLSAASKTYDNPKKQVSDRIVLQKNGWGYVYMEVKADGDFIELSQKTVTQADFTDGRFDLAFKIHPERLHRGKNLGAIRFLTVHGETAVQITATAGNEPGAAARDREITRSSIARYLTLREEYESGKNDPAKVLAKLQRELDAIRGACGSSLLHSLFQAETYLDAGRPDQAALCLDSCRDQIAAEEERTGTLYCFYQYLQYRVNPDETRRDAVLRLLRKKLDKRKGRFYLQLLLLKMEPELFEEGPALFDSFKTQYRNGCHSPFLYIEACRLLEKDPALLVNMEPFEIHVLYYGVTHGMIGEALALRAASLASGAKFFHRLYYRLLASLYEKYPEKEILTAVCCLLIKGNMRTDACFPWYEKGIKEEISLTRIYEYYLYSLPASYDQMLPKQVLLYFSYEHSHMDRRSRSVLYANVLTYLKPGDRLYKAYEREMEKFAMEQLFEGRIDRFLAVIYRHMIYRDIIDAQVARVLPGILRANRICCQDASMKYVVVGSALLEGEDAYPLNDGTAYVPLYFDDCVLLFQDVYGNRYMDVPYTKEPVLEERELEERCFEMFPDHPMLKMRACLGIMEKEEIDGDGIRVLQDALDSLPVKELYRQHMIYRDIIDAQVARVLPGILRANRICCQDASMKYVVVGSALLEGEDAYPLNDGTAYVPLYFDDCVLLFQDVYGNRYMDVPYTKEPVLEERELEERCFEMFPDHPMLKMRACLGIMEKEEIDGDGIRVLQDALDSLPVKELYQQKMLTRIIAYYNDPARNGEEAMNEEGGAYLLRLDKKRLSRMERVGICETLISQDLYKEAYGMIREFGEEGLRIKRLLKLCTKLISQNLAEADDLLLHMARRIFLSGKGDGVILDYLCRYFNGANSDMYRILVQAVREHTETYDMEERLLAQLLFTGSDKHLDTVFDLYAGRKKTSDAIVKAYFTIRCVDYFLKGQTPGDRVFAYLEGAINGSQEIRKLPEIYLMAMTKYYAGLPSLEKEQQQVCRRCMAVLLDQGMVFAYFKDLAPYVDLPGELLDKEIVEYRGTPEGRPVLMVRVLPDEEEFHEEELKPVYKGIYVRQKLLFEGEVMEYTISEYENGEPVEKANGRISCREAAAGDRGNRFSALNTMGLCLAMKDDQRLKEAMLRYVTESQAAKELFPLAE